MPDFTGRSVQARSLFALIDVLVEMGWRVQLGPPTAPLRGAVLACPGVLAFAMRVRACESPSGQAWFFGSEEYLDQTGEGWNFLETQVSLPSAEGDDAWAASIRRFWSGHVPFALSARGDYAYLAIDADQRIWTGTAPELEDARLVATNIDEFVQMLERQAGAKAGPLFEDWLRNA